MSWAKIILALVLFAPVVALFIGFAREQRKKGRQPFASEAVQPEASETETRLKAGGGAGVGDEGV